uniref:Uncharacterized protein ycf72 n=1 Tax=Oryza rufipogon TaxID=4529 RepID=A0A0E0P6A4_ORYRU
MTKDETLLVFTLVVSSVSVFLFGILLFMVLISATRDFRERTKSKLVKIMIWAGIVVITFAIAFWDTKQTSPYGNLKVADLPSFAISFATAPAALANCPPLPRVISMLCMAVPKGISIEVDSSFLSKNPFPNCTSFFQSIRLSRCI